MRLSLIAFWSVWTIGFWPTTSLKDLRAELSGNDLVFH